ncbi:hypothetical protein D3C81_2332820 [compost metagenome]
MTPEPCVPGAIQVVQCSIALFQPYTESLFTIVAIAVAAIFVRDMPNQKSRMILITLG